MYIHVAPKTLILRGFNDETSCYENRDPYDWICYVDIYADLAVLSGMKGTLGSKKLYKEIFNILIAHNIKHVMYERHGKLKRITL